MLRVGRLSIGTLHPTIYPTCSRNQEHRATITTDIAMSFKNVERYIYIYIIFESELIFELFRINHNDM